MVCIATQIVLTNSLNAIPSTRTVIKPRINVGIPWRFQLDLIYLQQLRIRTELLEQHVNNYILLIGIEYDTRKYCTNQKILHDSQTSAIYFQRVQYFLVSYKIRQSILLLLFISGYSFDKHDKNQGNCNFSSLAAILE